MSKSAKTAPLGAMPALPPIDFAPYLDASTRGMEAVALANAHAFQRMARMNHELFGFASRRLEHDRAVLKQMAACKSPRDAMVLVDSFIKTATQQYTKEIEQISALYVEHAAEALSDIDHEIDELAETPAEG